jgi:hypothetical protein
MIMNKTLCICALLANTIAGNAYANPCMPIAMACMDQGYYKGGHNDHNKGLVIDCVKPVCMGNKKILQQKFSADVKNACLAEIKSKMSDQNYNQGE